jgi:hypothetical protein
MPPSKKSRRALPAKAAPTPQIGRRPSSPAYLGVIGLMWIAVGVVDIVLLKVGWRIVVGVVSMGIGLFFLRGAAMTIVRREERSKR